MKPSMVCCSLVTWLLAACAGLTSPLTVPAPIPTTTVAMLPTPVNASRERHARLAAVSRWFYYLDVNLGETTLQKIASSTYDMIVIEPIFTERSNTSFAVADMVSRFHSAAHPKLVIAYVDIGQAEDWRTYWQPGWKIGNPDWIVANDPDGWTGNYPVTFWRDEWRNIWLGQGGYLQKILDAKFDGIYLDWVEAYSDENVITAAKRLNVDPRAEMIRWVGELAAYGRGRQPGFIVIAQNAAELTGEDRYLAIVDAISQEQIWFDGAANNNPPGDCPLPRTDAEIGADAYVQRLSEPCRETYKRFPASTLHVSSESYLRDLTLAHDKGKIIFTIDYALKPDNVTWVYNTSRALGFVPFVSERKLGIYLQPVP